jgi:hypothetical protein
MNEVAKTDAFDQRKYALNDHKRSQRVEEINHREASGDFLIARRRLASSRNRQARSNFIAHDQTFLL